LFALAESRGESAVRHTAAASSTAHMANFVRVFIIIPPCNLYQYFAREDMEIFRMRKKHGGGALPPPSDIDFNYFFMERFMAK
jgi:hypothetical protein